MTNSAADRDVDAPVKIVGRRRPPSDPLTVRRGAREDARRWRRELGGHFIPRGVFRFRTHAEADEWLWTMITRPQR